MNLVFYHDAGKEKVEKNPLFCLLYPELFGE